jgi:hypothetical protein
MAMPEDFIKAQAQQALGDFLRVDSDLAFTFLQTAIIEADTDPRHSESALGKARVALATIRHLVVRIEDPVVRAEIESRADDLDFAISTFSI